MSWEPASTTVGKVVVGIAVSGVVQLVCGELKCTVSVGQVVKNVVEVNWEARVTCCSLDGNSYLLIGKASSSSSLSTVSL